MHALLFIVLIIAALGQFVLHSRLLQAMRAQYPAVWESFGKPTPFGHSTISSSLSVLRFLWRKEYEAFDDPAFIQLAAQLRTFSIGCVVFFAFVCIAVSILDAKGIA